MQAPGADTAAAPDSARYQLLRRRPRRRQGQIDVAAPWWREYGAAIWRRAGAVALQPSDARWRPHTAIWRLPRALIHGAKFQYVIVAGSPPGGAHVRCVGKPLRRQRGEVVGRQTIRVQMHHGANVVPAVRRVRAPRTAALRRVQEQKVPRAHVLCVKIHVEHAVGPGVLMRQAEHVAQQVDEHPEGAPSR